MNAGHGRHALAARIATIVAGGAVYGFALGAGKNLLYAYRSAIKFPLLLLGTAAICALAHFMLARFLAVPLTLRAVVTASLQFAADLAVLLASLAPVSLFLGRTMIRPVGTDLGGYPEFVTTNMVFVAGAGALALHAQVHRLGIGIGIGRARAWLLAAIWLAVSLLVGGQLAFWLRPFFGIASLTGAPPFLLGDEPTATGARNFYEVVWQFAVGTDLDSPRGR